MREKQEVTQQHGIEFGSASPKPNASPTTNPHTKPLLLAEYGSHAKTFFSV